LRNKIIDLVILIHPPLNIISNKKNIVGNKCWNSSGSMRRRMVEEKRREKEGGDTMHYRVLQGVAGRA